MRVLLTVGFPHLYQIDFVAMLIPTPVPWTLTLGELLRLKPELLEELGQSLAMQGVLTKEIPSQLALSH